MRARVFYFAVLAGLSSLAISSVGHPRLTAEENGNGNGNVWKVEGPVFSVAYSPDGQTLAAGVGLIDQSHEIGHTALGGTVSCFSSEIRLWNVASGKERYRVQGDPPHGGLQFGPDGKTLVAGGGFEKQGQDEFLAGVVKVWDSRTGKEKLSLEQPRLVSCTAVSSDGRTLATGSFDNTVRLWDLTTGKVGVALKGHENTENANLVNCVAFSPDGKTLASGSYEAVVRLWDMTGKKEQATLPIAESWAPGIGVFAVAFSPDGKLLAVGVDDGVMVWDVTARILVATLQGGRCSSLAFRPDGKVLAWEDSDNVVHLSDVASGQELGQQKGHTDHVFSIAFSPDGKTVVSGSADRTIRFWDIEAVMKKQE